MREGRRRDPDRGERREGGRAGQGQRERQPERGYGGHRAEGRAGGRERPQRQEHGVNRRQCEWYRQRWWQFRLWVGLRFRRQRRRLDLGRWDQYRGNSNSGSGGGNTSASHTHNWVAQTSTVHHDAEYRTVHHDAEYRTVHHDAVTQERHICNGCNADITGNESAHIKANILNGCGGWHSSIVTIQQAYDEQVLVRAAYDEQVLVRAAWDETVTTGYKCSTCGATR